MPDTNYDADEPKDPQAEIVELLHAVSQNLESDLPDFVDVARKIESLQNGQLRASMAPEQNERVTELHHQATDKFVRKYEDIHDQAQSIRLDATKSFAKRVEEMQPALDPLRWAADSAYFRRQFYALIGEKYEALQNVAELLRDEKKWTAEKRDWLRDYIEAHRADLHHKDTRWLRDIRILVEHFLAYGSVIDKDYEESFLADLRVQENAQQAITSMASFGNLFGYALGIPLLEKLSDDAIVVLDGKQRTKSESLTIVKKQYHKSLLGYLEGQMKAATGLDQLESYATFQQTQPFDRKQSFDELHRIIGRAWIVLDPIERQPDRRVLGYLTLDALATGGVDDLIQTEDGRNLVEASGVDSSAVRTLILPEVNSSLLDDADRSYWMQLEDWVNTLFDKLSAVRDQLQRIHKRQMPYAEAADYLVSSVLPYSDHQDILNDWKFVQKGQLQEYEDQISAWENKFIPELSLEELEQLCSQMEASTIYKSPFSDSKTVDAVGKLIKRVGLLIDNRKNVEQRREGVEMRIAALQKFEQQRKWQEGESHANALRVDLRNANYLTTGERDAFLENVEAFLRLRDAHASESDMDELWQNALAAFDETIVWEDLLSRYEGKRYNKRPAASRRGSQYRFARARYSYLKANTFKIADAEQGLNRDDLIKEADEYISQVPDPFFKEDERFSGFQSDVKTKVEEAKQKESTRQTLHNIESQLPEDADSDDYRQIFEELWDEPELDEHVRREFLRQFAEKRWKAVVKVQIEEFDYDTADYQRFATLRYHIQTIKNAGFWYQEDEGEFRSLVRKIISRFDIWHREMEPAESSLFGVAFAFADYDLWIDKLTNQRVSNYHETLSYAILALFEPEANAGPDEQLQQVQLLHETINSHQIQLSFDSEGKQARYQNWLKQVLNHDSWIILVNGLIYATSRLIENFYRVNKDKDQVAKFQDQIHKAVQETRTVSNNDASVMRKMWEHWLAASRIYHARLSDVDDAVDLRRLYANYLRGTNEWKNEENTDTERPYWVKACLYAWKVYSGRIESRLLESIRQQFDQRPGDDPNDLAQFLEYVVIVETLRGDYGHDKYRGTIMRVDTWRTNNQGAFGKAKDHYQSELYDSLYANNGLKSGLINTYERVEQLKARVEAVAHYLPAAGLVDANPEESFQKKVSKVTMYLNQAVESYTRLRESLLKYLKEWQLDSTLTDLDRDRSALESRLTSALGACPLPDGQDGRWNPVVPTQVAEYRRINELNDKVIAFYTAVNDEVGHLAVFSPPASTDLQKHFEDTYERLEGIDKARQDLRDYLKHNFRNLFPEEGRFEDKLNAEVLETKLKGQGIHLPPEFREQDIVRGLDDHLRLLKDITEKADRSREALKKAKEAFEKWVSAKECVEAWGDYFVSCHVLISEKRNDHEDGVRFSGDNMLPENFNDLGPRYVYEQKKEDRRPSEAPIFATLKKRVDGAKESWHEWDKNLSQLDRVVTTDTQESFREAFREFIDKMQAWLDIQRTTYGQDSEEGAGAIYREYIYAQHIDFDEMLRQVREIDTRLHNGPFDGEIIEQVKDFNKQYGEAWKLYYCYVGRVHDRFAGYISQINQEIQYLENQQDDSQGCSLFWWWRKPVENDNTDDIESLKVLRNFLQWI